MKRLPKITQIVLVASVAFNILFIAFLISKRFYYIHQGYINSHPNGSNDSLITYTINKYKANDVQVSLFKRLPHRTSNIVFMGTSLTQGFPLQEIFGNCDLINRGIGGNTATDILRRIDEAIEGKPKKIFLEVGTNDIGREGETIDSVFVNLKQIIATIKKESPITKIYVQSVLPFGINKNTLIEQYNNKVAAYCKANNLTFINIYPLFLDRNKMADSLTTDGTHLKGDGYFIWANSIKKYINE